MTRMGSLQLMLLLALAMVVATVGVPTASATLPAVAICATNPAYDSDVQTKLEATGRFSSVTLIACQSSTPTVATLQQYSAVIVYSDAFFADPTTLGNNLATYLNAGGRVVVATFAYQTGYVLAGQLVTGGYLPFTLAAANSGTNLTLVPDISGSPLLAGVSSFNGGTSSFEDAVTLTTGATQVAHWSNGVPLVAYKGNVVGLNFYPPSSTARGDFWLASTDGATLLANALLNQGPAPAPSATQHVGYCSVAGDTTPAGVSLPAGTFLELVGGQPATTPEYAGAVPANYLEGVGITCDRLPGYNATGATVGYFCAGDPGVYPYYAQSS